MSNVPFSERDTTKPIKASDISVFAGSRWFYCYWKISKIRPSMCKSLKLVTQVNPPLNRPSKYNSPGGWYLEIALKDKVKQSKNGKFPSNYKGSPIDFESQISLRR